MKDLLFVLVSVGFFALAGLYVRACARILGDDAVSTPASPEVADTSQPAA